MTGHIKLGTQSEEKDFILVDPNQRMRSLVNPMAVKTGTGAASYNDFENWDYWVTDDWQQGVGREDPTDGGFDYAEVDTRWSGRLSLSALPFPSTTRAMEDEDASFNTYQSVDETVTVGGDDCEKVAIPIQGNGTSTSAWVYALSGYTQKDIKVSLWSDDTDEPDTELATATATSETTIEGYAWRRAALAYAVVDTTQYWLVIEPASAGDTITLPATTSEDYGGEACKKYASSAWSALVNSGSLAIDVFAILDVPNIGTVTAAAVFNSTIYVGNDAGGIYKFDAGGSRKADHWDYVGTVTNGVTDMVRWYGSLYVGTGSSTVARKITTGDAISDMGWNANLFLVWHGYLWRAVDNELHYTASSTFASWTEVDPAIGPDDYSIIGMSGLDDDVYVSTQQALWRVGAGDYVYGETLWDYESDTNGRGMTNRQGALYVPVDNTLWRIQTNVPLTNIWNREQTLPSSRAGTIRSIVSTSKEVIAYVDPSDANGLPTAWSFNNSGWHQVAVLPPGIGATIGIFDPNTTRVFFFTELGIAFSIPASLANIDPNQAADMVFEPDGWIDTGWFDGDLHEIVKDFDSVTIVGENITQTQCVKVYWKDDNSASEQPIEMQSGVSIETEDGNLWTYDDNEWNLLGTVTDNHEKLRWTDYTSRPRSRRLRIGVQMFTESQANTPEVEAIVVRHHPMVMDRWRWQLPIMAADNQQLVDGSINSMTTGDEIITYLLSLIEQEEPIVFQDIDDRRYEAKVASAAERTLSFEYYNGAKQLQRVMDITLEQVVSGELS
jgi:hypothetical protein